MVWSHARPKILVVCGPSGVGKSSMIKRLFAEYPKHFGFSISHTTRRPRPGEVDGYHYHFTTVEDMQKAIEDGKFLESAKYAGNLYGTSIEAVQKVAKEGKICVLDIDTQGVEQVKKNSDMDIVFTFVKPPSVEELERRLRDRGTETEETLKQRLLWANSEIHYGEQNGNFNLVVTNADLDEAYATFKDFILNAFKINGRIDVRLNGVSTSNALLCAKQLVLEQRGAEQSI